MKKEVQEKTWDQKKRILRKQYTILSDNDVIYEQGNEEELIANLQEKLGKSRNEILRIIKGL